MSAAPSSASPPEPAGSSSRPAATPLSAEEIGSVMGFRRFPPQKRRHRKPEDEIVVEDDEAELLSEVLQRVRARKRKQTIEPSDAARANTVYRFLRRSVLDPTAAAAEPAPEVPAGPTSPGAPVPTTLVTGAAREFKPRSPVADTAGFWNQQRLEWLHIFLSYAVVVIFLLAAYLAGRHTWHRVDNGSKLAPGTTPSSQWLPADYELLAAARSTDYAGDLSTALRITNILAKRVQLSPALRAYRATLNTRLEHVNDVETDLVPLLDGNTPPDVSAVVNTARAFNFVRDRQFDLALGCFAAVAKADPFDVPNLVHWGETLRRRGVLAAAAAKFQEALTRLPATTSPEVDVQRDHIAYLWRLSQVEGGHGADLEREIEQHLSERAPSGYWLLTAAAADLQNGKVPEAVDVLKRAQITFSPGEFNGLLRDAFFHSFAYRPEMNEFMPSLSPEDRLAQRLTMEYFVDQ